MGIQNKTVSKWECGLGCADLSLWADLSTILGVDMEQLMEGEIIPNNPNLGNIDKVRFYVCPSCGNILVGTGSASIFCCGRKLDPILPEESASPPQINVEEADIDYFITLNHPMIKEHYLSFAAYVKSDKIFLNRLYPEQRPSFRVPMITGRKLYVYCVKHGLVQYSNIL